MPATVLVADDNSNIQRMVTLELQGEGFQVIAVGNGEAAIRKISEARPDLVLADVFMPVRTGYEVCEFVKKSEALANIPVVLLIGAFDPLDEGEVQRVRADGVLKKPFVPPDPLVLTVKQLLERSGAVPTKAAGTAESAFRTRHTFDFVGNDNTPVMPMAGPVPPVPRPYPPEPPAPPAPPGAGPTAQVQPAEPTAKLEEKTEEEEVVPADWVTPPAPVAFLGREDEKPLVFSDLLQEAAAEEPAQRLTPEEEAREFLKEKTSAFYDFSALETGDSRTAALEPSAESSSREPSETTSPVEEPEAIPPFAALKPPAPPIAGLAPSESQPTPLPRAKQEIPSVAAWESSTPETAPAVPESEPHEESKSEPAAGPMSPGVFVPASELHGWLRETLLLGSDIPGSIAATESPAAPAPPAAGPPTETAPRALTDFTSRGPVEAAHEPPPSLTESVLQEPGETSAVPEPLEVSPSALEETGTPSRSAEEVTLSSQTLASQIGERERSFIAPVTDAAQEPAPSWAGPDYAEQPPAEPVPTGSKTEEAAEPVGGADRQETAALPAQDWVEATWEPSESPPRLGELEPRAPAEPFWSEQEPTAVEETTEPIATEPLVAEQPAVTPEPFFDLPVSAEAPSGAVPAEISSIVSRAEEPFAVSSEPITPSYAVEAFLSPVIETEPPQPVPAEPVQPERETPGEAEFQLTAPTGPAIAEASPGPENGELIQKVVEEVMARLSPELLEQISRELVKPLAEAVLKRSRPKPE